MNQLFSDEMYNSSSGFTEPDTEIRRIGAALRRTRVAPAVKQASVLAVECAADDGLESLLVGGILYFAHVALGTVGLQRKELLFE
jgi:hypothetical protein